MGKVDPGFPTGATVTFPVIGNPVEQVRSPAALSAIFAARGANAICVPLCVGSADVAALLASLYRVTNVGGVLVTVPHKRTALACCDVATERAQFVGAVNAMRRGDSGWFGDNTDGDGYLDGLARQGFDITGKRALLSGCGGAGAAIALEILNRGAARLALHDIDTSQRDAVIARFSQRFPGRVSVGSADPSGFDLVANATPMGMKAGDPMPVDAAALRPEQFVACVVTKPEISPLIAAARRLGCRTMTGTDMFNAQAETLADFLLAESSCRNPTGERKSAVSSVS